MEVKVGVVNVARELVIESSLNSEQVLSAVRDAIANGGTLALEDERGRMLCVPVEKLAYVEIGESFERRVGFGAL
jgi:hypothetical protein